MSVPSSTYIAGDIGGTNSRLQLFRVTPAGLLSPACSEKATSEHESLLAEETYPSQKFASLTFIISMFLKDTAEKLGIGDLQPIACCLAVAGPVRANKATITNVNWVLDGAEMSRSLNIPDVLIINDFVGIGYGLLALTRDDIIPINDVPLAADAPKACIGAGTGLGEVYLTSGSLISSSNQAASSSSSSGEAESEYNVWASEGGHSDFAPRDALEFGLLEYFKTQERVTRVSVERIVSGLGIPKIYAYFTSLFPAEVNDEVTERLRREDPGKVIAEFAENGKCNLCKQAIELFVKCYGAETGNLALKLLPFGGLFIAGGIAPKLKGFMLKNNLFYQHFVQKGRMQTLLEKVSGRRAWSLKDE
jgi:glucokinase